MRQRLNMVALLVFLTAGPVDAQSYRARKAGTLSIFV